MGPSNAPHKAVSLSRQIASIDIAIGQLNGRPKPKAAERERIIADLEAAKETLRAMEASR